MRRNKRVKTVELPRTPGVKKVISVPVEQPAGIPIQLPQLVPLEVPAAPEKKGLTKPL